MNTKQSKNADEGGLVVPPAAAKELEEMSQLKADRANEHRKYEEAYKQETYRMHGARQENAQTDLNALPIRGSYLDAGCGRGQMLDYAKSIGFDKVQGTEVVSYLVNGRDDVVEAYAHYLPFGDKSFDVSSSFDVVEHLLPGDDELLCKELLRVTKRYILITANNCTSTNAIGEELHINKRPYHEWDALFREWFPGAVVTWIPTTENHSTERWRIEL